MLARFWVPSCHYLFTEIGSLTRLPEKSLNDVPPNIALRCVIIGLMKWSGFGGFVLSLIEFGTGLLSYLLYMVGLRLCIWVLGLALDGLSLGWSMSAQNTIWDVFSWLVSALLSQL